MVFHQRSSQIDGFRGLAKIVWETRKNRAIYIFLNTSQNLVIAFVPAVDDYARAIGLDSEALQRHQTALQSPQRRNIRLRHDQYHARHAQNRAPLRREL